MMYSIFATYRRLAVGALFFLSVPAIASAQNFNNSDGTNIWSDPLNWDSGSVPDSFSSATVHGYTVAFDYNYDSSSAPTAVTIDGGSTLSQSDFSTTLEAGNIQIGENGGGSYNLSAGTLQADNILVLGFGNTGTLTQTGGTNSSNSIEVGYSGSGNLYQLEGGSINANTETVGYFGGGALNQSGGTNSVGDLQIGNMFSNIGGSYTLSTGSLQTATEELYANSQFGQSGSATQTISGALTMGGTSQYLIQYSGTTDPSLTAGSEIIGAANGDNAVFTLSAASNSTGSLDLGSVNGSSGGYGIEAFTGGYVSTLNAGSETIGDAGTGTMTLNGINAHNIVGSGGLIVGNQSGSNGSYSGLSGSVTTAPTVQIAAQSGSTGTMTLDSSSVLVANTVEVGGTATTPGGNGTFTLTNGGTAFIATKLSTGANGMVKVDNGSMITIGSTSGAANPMASAGDIQVNQGGTLGGAGTIKANLVDNGTVAPGDPVTLTLNGDYSQTAAGVLVLDIGGANSSDYDHLVINGSLTLDANSKLVLDFINGYAPADGTVFPNLITYQSLGLGSPDYLPSNVTIEGLTGFTGVVAPSAGLDGIDLDVITGGSAVEAVPEPSTWAMLLLGGGALFFIFRSKIGGARRASSRAV